MPLNSKAVANYFLELAKRFGETLDPMKIQKLVYFGHGWHLAFTKDPLIDDQIQAWDYGPVVPTLYHEFKIWGNGAILAPAIRSEFSSYRRDSGGSSVVRTAIPSIFEFAGPSGDVMFAKELIEKTWEVYGHMTGIELSQLTHESGTPWQVTRQRYPGFRSVGIPNRVIREHFTAKLEANESGAVA